MSRVAAAPWLFCASAPRREDLSGKHIVVVGLGVSGRAAVELALLRGAKTVTAVDRNPRVASVKEDPRFHGFDVEKVRVELGPHRPHTFLSACTIVVSPGVPVDEPVLASAINSGVKAVSELGFAAEVFPKSVKLAAVTGTNGKSTVTSFTGQILEQAGHRVFVGGNLGTPFSDAACQCLKLPADDVPFDAAVLEVSSYQLELPGSFSPSVGVILNLTPDHLERHETMEKYAETKCRLFQRMGPSELSILPHADGFLKRIASGSGDRSTRAWIGATPGVRVDEQMRKAYALVPTTQIEAHLDLTGLKAVGTHNVQNAATASLLALSMDVGVDKVQSAIENLTLLPHRMQIVAEQDGVVWINDSKATNIDAAFAGIKGLASQKAVVLLGGLPKVLSEDGALGFQKLAGILGRHRAIVMFGACREKIEEELREAGVSIPLHRTEHMDEAVQIAMKLSHKGDAILLSPACASFDQYHNFEHRGQVFQELATKYALKIETTFK